MVFIVEEYTGMKQLRISYGIIYIFIHGLYAAGLTEAMSWLLT